MAHWVDSELVLLHYWIKERESVRKAKESGLPKPWTTDPLLLSFRFCNVRRMDDRVSRELFERWYPRHAVRCGAELTCALFARLINWPEALDEVIDLDAARGVLLDRAARGKKVFTGAYVVPGVPGKNKVDSICDLIDTISASCLTVLKPSMRETWAELLKFDGMGSFLAGQVVADLAHTPAGWHWPDIETWAPLGPGSARGINRLRGIQKDKAVSQAEFENLLPELIAVLRPEIEDIWVDRTLHAMDLQNALCEYDKFRRLQLQEGKVRAKYDGKATVGNSDTQQSLFV
jgi:hypothetical protein